MTTPAKTRKAKPAPVADDSNQAAADTPAPKARKPRTPAKPSTTTDLATPLQLGFWPDSVRGVPNAALRGALFSISKEREMAKKRQRLAAVDGYQIIFKGERFNQRDLDLWEMLLHIGRQQAYGGSVEFVASKLLEALDRGVGGADYDELKEDIARLKAASVEILFTDTNQTFAGSLIQNFYRDEETQRYAVVFDAKMLKLYDSGYSHVDWEQRRKLKGDSLAKWLHGFYATHAAPLRYKVASIRELCGSTTGRLVDFRVALRKALDKLKTVGAITSWSIDTKTDLVTVRRKGSVSQQRHLENKLAAQANAEFLSGQSGILDGFDAPSA